MNKKYIKMGKVAQVGVAIIFIIMLATALAPLLNLKSPTEISTDILSSPSNRHILGTNDIGQDIFSRIVFGFRTSILISILVGFLTTSLAFISGSLTGLIGGSLERFIIRVADIFIILPEFILIILISTYIKTNFFTLAIIISIFNLPTSFKVVRSYVSYINKSSYIQATRAFGGSNLHILSKHILPGISPILISIFIKSARIAVFMEIGLSYLGINDSRLISLGKIMNNSMNYIYLNAWIWWLLPPGFVLSVFLLSLTYIGFYFERDTNNLEEN